MLFGAWGKYAPLRAKTRSQTPANLTDENPHNALQHLLNYKEVILLTTPLSPPALNVCKTIKFTVERDDFTPRKKSETDI